MRRLVVVVSADRRAIRQGHVGHVRVAAERAEEHRLDGLHRDEAERGLRFERGDEALRLAEVLVEALGHAPAHLPHELLGGQQDRAARPGVEDREQDGEHDREAEKGERDELPEGESWRGHRVGALGIWMPRRA